MKPKVESPGPLGEGCGGSLLGVVLCGGESRRMGRDKGLLEKDGRPWALHMADKLAPWKIPVFFSINERQLGAYSVLLPFGSWVIDSQGLAGPLEGLLSVHRRFPASDILLLACDMQDLDTATLSVLIAAWQVHEENVDFIAYGDERLWQPFCCIYTSRGLRKATGDSLQSLLRAGSTQALPITDQSAFNNYNTL